MSDTNISIRLKVNGMWRTLSVNPAATLLTILRDHLRLTGAKNGCGQGHCGACTVIVDGRPERACLIKAPRVDGRQVETIEGLAEGHFLHPLQTAFVDSGAVQCGYCTPGFIMAAKALLDRIPNPTDEEVKQALRHNLCRCTGYVKILSAIQSAVDGQRQPGEQSRPQAAATMIGHSIRRPGALARVTGAEIYTDDLAPAGMLYAAVRRSDVPHGQVFEVDISAASRMPGVVAVLTAADIPGDKNHGVLKKDWPVLAYDKVRYVGDALALVAAETPEQAQAAARAVQVDCQPLPVVSSPDQARQANAAAVHPGGNLLKRVVFDRGDIMTAFATCDVVLEAVYDTPFGEHAFLELESSLAVPDAAQGSLSVFTGSQDPFADRAQIAATLALPIEAVRVVHMPTGGAFGGKEDIHTQIHAALLAQATGRPVKLTLSRAESMRVHSKRHATSINIKTGATRDGRILAQDIRILGDTGAYASLGAAVMTRAANVSTGPYEVPHVHIECDTLYTNNPPAGSFRGFGATQAHFAAEAHLDRIAEELDMSPFALRRRNALRVGSQTNTGQRLLDSVGLLACLDQVEQAVQAAVEAEAAQPPTLPAHIRRGWGLACGYKNVGRGSGIPDSAGAAVEVTCTGQVHVRAGGCDVGQGLDVVLVQIAAQELGALPEQVELVMGDTALTLDGGPTNASRQTFVTGNAVRHAALVIRSALAQTAAEALDCAPEDVTFAGGQLSCPSGAALPLGQVATLAQRQGRATNIEYVYTPPIHVAPDQVGDSHFAYGFACQAVQVEADLTSGQVRVLQVIAATDVGRIINPQALAGQVEGAVVMGIGFALTEDFVVSAGQVLTDSLRRLQAPSIALTPAIHTIFIEDPAGEGPYGAKGAGEVAGIPTAPAIINAIHAATGVRLTRLPVDAQKLRATLARNA